MTLTAVSLFAGVGGFDLALERNGVNVVAAVEIDNNARGVLAHRFPNTTLFTDVCEVNGEQLIAAGFIPDRGIITGGFPCQDLSVAGKRAGLDGARSGLFWEICRLLDETKARYFILENVPGLLSSNGGRDMGAVVGALVERGYGIAYRVLDAQFFGVPQRRRRVVIVGCLGDNGNASSEILTLSEGLRGHLASRQQTRKTTPRKIADSAGDGGIVHELTVSDLTKGQTSHQAVAAGLLQPFSKSRRAQNPTDYETWIQGGVAPTLNAFDNATESRATVIAYSIREDAKANTFSATELRVTNALQAHQPSVQSHHAQTFVAAIPIQDGREIEKNQNGLGVGEEGDPAYTLDRTGGQAVVAPTLSATNNPSRSPQSSEVTAQVEAMVNATSTVRRLTPMECERLQGFPDNWTAERYDYKKKQVVPQADSARYKQMGNAVAVPVFEWVISRLVAVDAAQTEHNQQGGAA